MYKPWISKVILLLVVFALVLPVGQRTLAQDFQALLNAVDKLEANLQALVDQEAATRKQQLSGLESKIERLTQQAGGTGDPAIIEQIQKEILLLKMEIKNLAMEGTSGGPSGIEKQKFAEIHEQLEDLKTENLYLRDGLAQMRGEIEQSKSHLVSADDAAYDPHAGQRSTPSTGSTPTSSEVKVHGRMYNHWMSDLSAGADGFNEFATTRAYVTLKLNLSDYTAVKLTTDLRNIDDKYNIILKYAYLDWKPAFARDYLKVRFGLQATQYIDQMNKLWGRRYLQKTVSDQRKFLTSSDLGSSVIIGFGKKSKYGFTSLAVFNGTSYSHVEELNPQKDLNLVALLKPFKNVPAFQKSTVIMQYYAGTQNKEIAKTVTASNWKRDIFSLGGLLAYDGTIDVGFDFNRTVQGTGAESGAAWKTGVSLFGTFHLKNLVHSNSVLRTLNVFGRTDFYDPNTANDYDRETTVIIGIETTPVKGFKASLNHRGTSYQADGKSSEGMLYVNTLFKF